MYMNDEKTHAVINNEKFKTLGDINGRFFEVKLGKFGKGTLKTNHCRLFRTAVRYFETVEAPIQSFHKTLRFSQV